MWYDLDGVDAAVLFERRLGASARFIDEERAVAVGREGVLVAELGSDAVEAIGLGFDATAVAYDEARSRIATVERDGRTALWDLETRQQIGSFIPLMAPAGPSWVPFDADGSLVAGSPRGFERLVIDRDAWAGRACGLATATQPDQAVVEVAGIGEVEARCAG